MTTSAEVLAAGEVLALRLVTLAQRGQRTPCQSDPEAWFADDPDQRADAVEACGYCPLVELCGQAADAAGERFGVWGGVPRPIPRPARPQLTPDPPTNQTAHDEGATTMTHPNPMNTRPIPDDLRADILTDPTADQLAASVRCPACRGQVRLLNRPRLGVMTAEVEHGAKCPRWVYRFPEAAVALGPQNDHDGHLIGRVVTRTAAGDLIVRLRRPDGTPVHP